MEYLLFLQGIRENAPVFIQWLFVAISEAVIYLGPGIPIIIFLCFDKKKGSVMGFNLLVALAFNSILKLTACVYRPWVKYPELKLAEAAHSSATGYSFPSAHTTTATTVYGSFAAMNRKKKGLVIIMIVMILLTAFARNFLGAHTFLDVFVALFLSSVIMCINQLILGVLEKNPNFDIVILISIILVSVGALIYFVLKPYPMDYDAAGNLLVDPVIMMKDGFADIGNLLGWGLCWFFERRFVKFSVEGTKKEKIIRGAIAVVLFAGFYLGVFGTLKYFMDPRIAKFLKGFLTLIIVLGIYPYIIKRMQDKKAA